MCHNLGITPARFAEWPEDLLLELDEALEEAEKKDGRR